MIRFIDLLHEKGIGLFPFRFFGLRELITVSYWCEDIDPDFGFQFSIGAYTPIHFSLSLWNLTIFIQLFGTQFTEFSDDTTQATH